VGQTHGHTAYTSIAEVLAHKQISIRLRTEQDYERFRHERPTDLDTNFNAKQQQKWPALRKYFAFRNEMYRVADRESIIRSVPTQNDIAVPETLLKKQKSQQKATEQRAADLKAKREVR
jgi:hypothetical protein